MGFALLTCIKPAESTLEEIIWLDSWFWFLLHVCLSVSVYVSLSLYLSLSLSRFSSPSSQDSCERALFECILISILIVSLDYIGSLLVKVKTEGSNVDMTKDAESNFENTVTLSTEISFETSGEVASNTATDFQVNGILSDAFLVPSINIKVDLDRPSYYSRFICNTCGVLVCFASTILLFSAMIGLCRKKNNIWPVRLGYYLGMSFALRPPWINMMKHLFSSPHLVLQDAQGVV